MRHRTILTNRKQLGERIGDMGKPLIDGDNDGKCREVGDKFVPCPPGVPAGTLLGNLNDSINPVDGIDLELFRLAEDETPEDLASNLKQKAQFDDWVQWDECRAMRRHAFDIVAGRPGPADPYIRRTKPNLFGDPKPEYKEEINDAQMHAQARYLLAEIAAAAQSAERNDDSLYRAVKLPSNPKSFMTAFEEGNLVDLPLVATSTGRREGANEFLTMYGSDVLLEIRGPNVGLTGGPITVLATDDDEELMLGALESLTESLEWDTDDEEDGPGAEEAAQEKIKEIQALLDEYEEARKSGQLDRIRKGQDALRAIAEEYGLTDEYYFAGDELPDNANVFDYWDRFENTGESGQREVITGGRYRVVNVAPDPDGVYKTIIVLEHVGVFDPRVRGGIIPIRKGSK